MHASLCFCSAFLSHYHFSGFVLVVCEHGTNEMIVLGASVRFPLILLFLISSQCSGFKKSILCMVLILSYLSGTNKCVAIFSDCKEKRDNDVANKCLQPLVESNEPCFDS